MKLLLTFLFILTIDRIQAGSDKSPQSGSRQAAKPLKILLIAIPVWGHVNPLLATGEELVLRGHEVTLCIGVDEENSAKFEKKAMEYGVLYSHFESDLLLLITKQTKKKPGILKLFYIGGELSGYLDGMMQHLNQSLSAKSFDIILGSNLLVSALKCIDSGYNIPSVVIGTTTLIEPHQEPQWAWPGLLLGTSSDNLSFLERVLSVIGKSVIPFILRTFIIAPSKDKLEKYCPGLSVDELAFSAGNSLPYIVPTVIGFDYSRTQLPLIEYVGPLMVKSPVPLSEEIGEWLAGKPERSVVYVSTGSMFTLKEEHGRAILEGVMKTNYSLLWSLRKSNQWILDGLTLDTDRVLISEWTPQFSVLQSTAIHSAILHGGFNGVNEALWNGVPVIGLPQMVEQVLNIGRVTHNGLGLRLDEGKISSSAVVAALAAIDSGDYVENVWRFQKILRFCGGARRAADLAEHYEEVGYAHLIPSYIKYSWNWIQYYSVDVYTAFAMVFCIVGMSLLTCLRCTCKRCCQEKPKTE